MTLSQGKFCLTTSSAFANMKVLNAGKCVNEVTVMEGIPVYVNVGVQGRVLCAGNALFLHLYNGGGE